MRYVAYAYLLLGFLAVLDMGLCTVLHWAGFTEDQLTGLALVGGLFMCVLVVLALVVGWITIMKAVGTL